MPLPIVQNYRCIWQGNTVEKLTLHKAVVKFELGTTPGV